MKTRPATIEDCAKIAEIYNAGIYGRQATFRTWDANTEEIAAWLEHPNLPLLVAELEGEVVGWAHASGYRTSKYYSGIVEYSVYIATNAHGQGVGTTLLEAFFAACEKVGIWKLVSRIFPENTASLALCRKTGFREVGVYEKHAQLDGEWKDVIIVEKLLTANLGANISG
jgi:L-amino acid N-acyltransferase YncA